MTITPSISPISFSPLSYNRTDPWYYTPVLLEKYLDIYVYREIPASSGDRLFLITENIYVHHPEVLANDIYGDHTLWWIFGVRNELQDPVFDLKLGKLLIVPPKEVVLGAL